MRREMERIREEKFARRVTRVMRSVRVRGTVKTKRIIAHDFKATLNLLYLDTLASFPTLDLMATDN